VHGCEDLDVRGTVIEFDEYVGLGEVEGADGRRFLFHCVEIADGTRTIEVGTEVDFELRMKFGRDEAAQLRPPG
jgi:cold shock CspA family protein